MDATHIGHETHELLTLTIKDEKDVLQASARAFLGFEEIAGELAQEAAKNAKSPAARDQAAELLETEAVALAARKKRQLEDDKTITR